MGFLSGLPFIGDFISKVTDKIAPNKDNVIEGQNRINEAEISGAPASRLRLWRSFLGWALGVGFVWEVIGRPIIITYWPNVNLPPSMLAEIRYILLGMLGLGF